jgi:hypothetical protein
VTVTTATVDVMAPGRKISVEQAADRPNDELWLSEAELEHATGWKLKAEGLCRDAVCIPLASDTREAISQDSSIHVSALWRTLDRPILHDAAHTTWMLGEAAEDRARELASLNAPDFTLPDIEGKLHSLSDYRGNKVLLATWASW